MPSWLQDREKLQPVFIQFTEKKNEAVNID